MSVLAHCEDACGWKRMRHPIVCILDIVGLFTTVGLLVVYQPNFVTASLPLAIILQYTVSCLFHWLPEVEWRSKLDRSCIFILIGATYVPYWGGLLTPEEAWQRLPWVAVGVFIGIGFLLMEVSDTFLGLYWAVLAISGLIISSWLGELPRWLPPEALLLFWIGSSCYGIQQVVFAIGSKYPNRFSRTFGFREIQHSFLLVGTTISTFVLSYI